MYKRWRSINRAVKLNPNYPIDPEVLKKQEEATAKLKLIYREIDTQELGGNGLHEHICTFEMLSNDKTRQAKECKEWLKNTLLNIQILEVIGVLVISVL